VYDVLVASGIFVDAASVFLQGLRHCNTAGNRSSLVDLLEHVSLANGITELVNLVLVISVRDEAVLMWAAVSALEDGRATDAVVKASGSVDSTCLISDSVVLHVLKGICVPATVTSTVISLA
jgi:hypothetical protein